MFSVRYESPMASEPKRSRAWRLENSWWLGLILFTMGMASWASFAYLALRTKERRWLVWAGVYLVAVVAAFLLIDVGNVGAITLLVLWAGSFVHGLAIREEVLDRLSFVEDPRLRKARSVSVTRDAAEDLAKDSPEVALEAGVGQDAHTFGGLVDVNHAPASELAQLPGFSDELAKKVVQVREEIGGFDSLLDFATVLDLPPDVVSTIRERTVCLPR